VLAGLALGAVFAASPQQAAVKAVYHDAATSMPRALKTNVVGRYAVVHVKGGMIESEHVDNLILLEHFSFGWQPLNLANDRCMFEDRFAKSTTAALLVGMPVPARTGRCKRQEADGDTGVAAAVEAVRRLMRGPFVPSVHVAGIYAIGEWYGAGGGEGLFKRIGPAWTRIGGGGGAMGVDVVHAYGVPRSLMCALHVYDARCETT